MANWTSVNNRQDLLISVTAVALLLQLWISMPLWWSADRSFPQVQAGFVLPFWVDTIMWVAANLSLLLVCLKKTRNWSIPVFLCIMGLWWLQDLVTIQAWAYHYFLMLLLCWLLELIGNEEKYLSLLRLFIVTTYFWTGFHKVNLHFVEEVFPWLMEIFPSLEPLKEFHFLAYALAVGELLLGIGLLVPFLRKFTIYLLTAFHGVILLFLIQDGWNKVVYAWNISMVLYAWLLFYHPKTKQLFYWGSFKKDIFALSFVFLVAVAPLLQVWKLWPYDLSMMMYTGLPTELYIQFDKQMVENQTIWEYIPKSLSEDLAVSSTNYTLSVDDWTMKTMQVPTTASEYYYKRISFEICKCIEDNSKIKFILVHKKRWSLENRLEIFQCSDLFE